MKKKTIVLFVLLALGSCKKEEKITEDKNVNTPTKKELLIKNKWRVTKSIHSRYNCSNDVWINDILSNTYNDTTITYNFKQDGTGEISYTFSANPSFFLWELNSNEDQLKINYDPQTNSPYTSNSLTISETLFIFLGNQKNSDCTNGTEYDASELRLSKY